MAKRYTDSIEHNGITINIANVVTLKGTWSNKNKKRILESAVKFYIDNGRYPTYEEMKSPGYSNKYNIKIAGNAQDNDYIGSAYDGEKRQSSLTDDLNTVVDFLKGDGFAQFQKDNPHLRFDDERNIIRNEETGEPLAEGSGDVGEFNPYTKWLEQQQERNISAEYGLLQAQTKAGLQSAELSAQQSMIQNAQFKDQLIEQVKLDRMAKMRQGISPMQIAQENLQFMVGNMQANQQQMGAVNQARLGAMQQEEMNPYQAYLNSLYGAGYQANANLAAGFAASDASDMMSQMYRYASSQGRPGIILPGDDAIVRGQEVITDPNKKK